MKKRAEIELPVPPEPRGFYVGTSGWAYDIWQPEFFPEGLPKAKYLPYYASRLTACEVNFTFRNRLKESTALKWISETPESFRFVCKAHQFITHIRRLKNCEEPIQNFASGMEPLLRAKRYGGALFQLPPNLKADPKLLEEFLRLVPKPMKPAFEFRHESWFNEETYSILRKAGAALCLAETDDLVTPEVYTADFAYFRLRLSDYSADARKNLAERVRAARERGEVYAFFKHEERPESPLYAVELLGRVLEASRGSAA